jgi:hypothetical protein
MAYLAFDFAAQADRAPALSGRDAGFSAIETAVIRLARTDKLATIRPPSRIGAFVRRFFGLAAANRLADPRLEALRCAVVMCRHGRRGLTEEQVGALVAQGFRFEQIASLRAE